MPTRAVEPALPGRRRSGPLGGQEATRSGRPWGPFHPATIPRMTPENYVQEKAAASGSSFYYAFLFLPKEKRAAITAFYAFCREIDDVVDEVTDPGVAQTKLAWWQVEVAQSYAGNPSHPVMKALMPMTA